MEQPTEVTLYYTRTTQAGVRHYESNMQVVMGTLKTRNDYGEFIKITLPPIQSTENSDWGIFPRVHSNS